MVHHSDLSWRKRYSGFADKPSPISSPSIIGSPVHSAEYIRSPMSYHGDLEEDAEVIVSRTGETDCECPLRYLSALRLDGGCEA